MLHKPHPQPFKVSLFAAINGPVSSSKINQLIVLIKNLKA